MSNRFLSKKFILPIIFTMALLFGARWLAWHQVDWTNFRAASGDSTGQRSGLTIAQRQPVAVTRKPFPNAATSVDVDISVPAQFNSEALHSIEYQPEKPATSVTKVSAAPETMPVAAKASGYQPLASKTPIALGDTLKITFFETLEPVGSDKNRAVSLIEHSVLSGRYVVQQSGHVVLPMLGAIEAGGGSIETLTLRLEQGFRAVLRQEPKVTATIVARQPIYFLGRDARAGQFPFESGMVVLHAVALAGATVKTPHDVYMQAELVRQQERYVMARKKLERALALALCLRAEQENLVATPSDRLVELAGKEMAEVIVKRELKLRRLLAQTRQFQMDAFRTTIASSKQEIEEIENKLLVLKRSIKLKVKRNDTISRLRKKGVTSNFLANQAQDQIYTFEAYRQDARVALTRARRRMIEAEIKLKKLSVDYANELAIGLSNADQEVAANEVAASSSARFLSDLRQQSGRQSVAEDRRVYSIVRQTRDGPRQIDGNEMTRLQPGDLVRVLPAVSDNG